MKILNFGSINLDYVYNVDHFVRPGETLSSSHLDIFCGGKGLNQSIAIARSGAEVYHAGAVGASDGEVLLKTLAENKVNTDSIEKLDSSLTGHAIIQVDDKGENSILLFGGANQLISEMRIDDILLHFQKGDFLILQNEISNLQYIIDRAFDKEMIIILNPSPMNNIIKNISLDKVSYLILNEIEAADICQSEKEDDLAEVLHRKYPDAKIILTLGKNGVRYIDRDTKLKMPIFKVDVVDTTAAGDTFTGYFVGQIAKGETIENSLKIASMAAALSVSRKGAEPSIPVIDEVLQKLEQL